MAWNKRSKIIHKLPENKWFSFISEEIGSFSPGYYGVTVLTGDRRIAAIRTTALGTLSAFNSSNKLLMTTGLVPGAKAIFNALDDNLIRFVWKINELQAIYSATNLGYVPIIEGMGLKMQILGPEKDSKVPGFDIYMVGGNIDAPETEPRIKDLGTGT